MAFPLPRQRGKPLLYGIKNRLFERVGKGYFREKRDNWVLLAGERLGGLYRHERNAIMHEVSGYSFFGGGFGRANLEDFGHGTDDRQTQKNKIARGRLCFYYRRYSGGALFTPGKYPAACGEISEALYLKKCGGKGRKS